MAGAAVERLTVSDEWKTIEGLLKKYVTKIENEIYYHQEPMKLSELHLKQGRIQGVREVMKLLEAVVYQGKNAKAELKRLGTTD